MGDNPKSENQCLRQDDAVARRLGEVEITHDHLLGGAVAIAQPKLGFRVGTDAVFLAASVGMNHGRVLDLGAGVGGVSLCLAHRLDKVHITAIEIDPLMAALAQANAKTNGFDERLCVRSCNVQTLPPVLASSFDHVVSNPPYHHGTGTTPQNWRLKLARMGDGSVLDDWVKAALWAAKPRGRISFICRADRSGELIHLFTKAGASETLQFPLWPRPMVPAGRVIIQVRKSVIGPGAILPGIIVHNDDGGFTDVANRVMKGEELYMAHPARKAQKRDE